MPMHVLLLGAVQHGRVRGDTSAVLEQCLTRCDNEFAFGLLMIGRSGGAMVGVAALAEVSRERWHDAVSALRVRLSRRKPHQLPPRREGHVAQVYGITSPRHCAL